MDSTQEINLEPALKIQLSLQGLRWPALADATDVLDLTWLETLLRRARVRVRLLSTRRPYLILVDRTIVGRASSERWAMSPIIRS